MTDWFKDWFNSPNYLTVYSHRNDDDAEKLTELILGSIDIPPDSKVLDAACGAGRYVIKFAKKGFNTFGFDLSDALLDEAKHKLLEDNIDVNLFRADIREICLKKSFRLILNLFTSFGYFQTDEENFSFIRNSNDFLKPTGYYVLDYFNKNFLLDNLIPLSTREEGNLLVEETRRIENGRVVKNIEIKNGDSIDRFEESVKIYSPAEIISEFKRAGFNLYKSFGSYEGEDFNELKSERFIAIFSV